MTEKEKDIQTDSQGTTNGQHGQQEQAGTGNVGADKLPEEDALDKKQRELDEMRDKYLRLVAEFDNFKKRTAKERIELIQTANKEVIISLLDVLDDSERAQKQLESTPEAGGVIEGVSLVFNKLRNILQSRGLKPMESIGRDFNPDMHEAITEVPAPDESKKGKVLDEVEKGYYLNDKIIRFAKVVVGK